MEEETKEQNAHACAGALPRGRKSGRSSSCGRATCKKRLSIKEKHHIGGVRVCDACYKKVWRGEHDKKVLVAAASLRQSTTTSSRTPVTRSVLPSLPISFSYSTHDWELHHATDDSPDLAAQWQKMGQDPRAAAFPWSHIQNSPHHRQLSILSARHDWREMGRLAARTEAMVRKACEETLGERASAFRHLHLAALKLLVSDPGYGLQQYHFDASEFSRAKELVSVLFFCSKTLSTEMPLHTAATMRPAFVAGDIATPSEDETIRRLIQSENFRSFPVEPGDMIIFSGTVCHRGIPNPNSEPRWVLYFLFSPSHAGRQDDQQRIPFRQPLHSHLSNERRWAIINYDKLGMTVEAISLTVGCSKNTVYHWLNVYRDSETVDDSPRSGRPKLETPSFAASARAHPFAATPRMLKAEHHTLVSKRTVRRRLNDDSLFGRVSRHFFILKPDIIRARLSFANGYNNWSEEQWMTVLFSDEKIFTLGLHGRVWVQRPKNTAWRKEYCLEQPSHPPGVNFWCCFSGRGTGGCETFSYSNTGSVMRGILQYHLINSARKLFHQRPPEQWWLLWDNSPIHKAIEVRTCLHNHGVSCLELPPYSPDLNPTEHLFADLARRVEQRFPRTVEELEEAIHEEWARSDLSFLRHLASSMRSRIQAVINNAGHATKY